MLTLGLTSFGLKKLKWDHAIIRVESCYNSWLLYCLVLNIRVEILLILKY